MLPKLREVGVSEMAGVPVAVPVRATVWGEPRPLSATLTVAVRVPAVVGLKVTRMLQEAAAATLVPQVFVWVKSPGLARRMTRRSPSAGPFPCS